MSAARRRLLVVSHRPLDLGGPARVRWDVLADELPRHGWAVETFSPPASFGADEFAADPGGARAARLRTQVMDRVGRAARPVAERAGVRPEAFPPSFAWSLTGRRAVREAVARSRPDAVVATGPPPAAWFAAAAALSDAGAPPLVVELRDLWAGHPYYDAGGTVLRRIQGRALRRAAAVVVVAEVMRERLAALHPSLAPRMHVLANGFDPKLFELRGRPRRPGPFTLVHAGALYGDRDVRALVEVLARPEFVGQVRLVLVGGLDAASEEALRRHPAVAVETHPPMTWQAATEVVAGADAAVVLYPRSLGDEMAVAIKAYEALALGKPVLAITSGGGTERLLRGLGQDAGCAREGDAGSIAAALRRLLEDPPPPLAPEALAPWDRRRIAADYAALLDGLVAATSSSS